MHVFWGHFHLLLVGFRREELSCWGLIQCWLHKLEHSLWRKSVKSQSPKLHHWCPKAAVENCKRLCLFILSHLQPKTWCKFFNSTAMIWDPTAKKLIFCRLFELNTQFSMNKKWPPVISVPRSYKKRAEKVLLMMGQMETEWLWVVLYGPNDMCHCRE